MWPRARGVGCFSRVDFHRCPPARDSCGHRSQRIGKIQFVAGSGRTSAVLRRFGSWLTACARIYTVTCIKRTCVTSAIQTASSLCSHSAGEPVLLQHAARSLLVPDMHNGSGCLLCACRAFRNPIHRLSAGQRRRVALASLVISPAQLWLLDEPTAALDRSGIQTLETLIQDHCAVGGAVVMSTHENPFLCSRFWRLEIARQPPHHRLTRVMRMVWYDPNIYRCHHARYAVGGASWR